MNTRTMAVATAIGAVTVMALLFAYPAIASPSPAQNPTAQQMKQMMHQSQSTNTHRVNLAVGQTITLTSVAGGYWQVGDAANNGTASGTMDFKVTGVFTGGYSLLLTGGSVSVGTSACTVTGGSAELGRYGIAMVGQGRAGSTSFLFKGIDLGKFGSTSYGVVRIDLTNGTSEYAIKLLVTVAV